MNSSTFAVATMMRATNERDKVFHHVVNASSFD